MYMLPQTITDHHQIGYQQIGHAEQCYRQYYVLHSLSRACAGPANSGILNDSTAPGSVRRAH